MVCHIFQDARAYAKKRSMVMFNSSRQTTEAVKMAKQKVAKTRLSIEQEFAEADSP